MTTHKIDTTGDQPDALWWLEFNPSMPFDAPADCLSYRIRVRHNQFVDVVMRFADRMEIREVIRKDGRQMPGQRAQGNYRAKTTKH